LLSTLSLHDALPISFSAEASETVARLFGLLVIGAPAAVALAYMEKITYAAQNTWIPACYQLATALLVTFFAPVLTVSSGADRLRSEEHTSELQSPDQ